MSLTYSNIVYKDSTIFYQRTGTGPVPLLLFHGFGQNASVFDSWAQPIGNDFTLYSFDLYFHGQSMWPDEQAFEKSDWREIIKLFIIREKLSGFAVAGYSLGGKFALATVEAFPDEILGVYLIAPDGVKHSFWYWIATYPWLTRNIFKTMINHPERFGFIVRLLDQLHLVNKGVLRFAQSQMDTEEKRKRVYNTWITFRHIRSDVNTIARIINSRKIKTIVITGSYDKMIKTESMNILLNKLYEKNLIEVEAGHNDVVSKAGAFIRK